MTVALLFARTLQDAVDGATIDWKWDYVGELRSEFRRPDTREVIRFLPDQPGCIRGLAWFTTVYLGRRWQQRGDVATIEQLLEEGFFVMGEPELPPPRPRRTRDDRIQEIRQQLARLERS